MKKQGQLSLTQPFPFQQQRWQAVADWAFLKYLFLLCFSLGKPGSTTLTDMDRLAGGSSTVARNSDSSKW